MGPGALLLVAVVGCAASLLSVRDWLAPHVCVLDLRRDPVRVAGLLLGLGAGQALALAALIA